MATLIPAAAAAGSITADEAMALAFPGCDVSRAAVFLTEGQRAAAQAAAGGEIDSALVTRFEARCGGAAAGWGYLDTHRVRTLPETVLVMLGADGRVRRVEVIAFREPEEYRPRQRFYRQYDGRALDAELELTRGIRPVAGATLTARATTAAVRRVLALHQALAGGER